ncbi:MAG: hypothetical protein LBG29_07070 [Synergistaceae bacterium]|jgi:superfamily II DNA or RNA helicase|nr:hypothetical protein [Synergistaceae bacterium]
MKITISDNLYIEGIPEPLARTAYRELTVPNPEYAKRERLGKWLGGTVPELSLCCPGPGGTLILPRGYAGRLLSLAKENNTPVAIADKRLVLPKTDLTFGGELRAADVLTIPRIEFVKTSFGYWYDDDWTDMITALIHDSGRNELIYRIICQLLDDGRRILALSQRVEHCETLYRALSHSRPGAAALVVGTRKKERGEGIRRIASGDARILFATQLADEGLDAPILDALILMTPQKSEGRTIQRAGRVLRALDGKRQPLIIDLVDNNVGILRYQAQTRFLGAYRQLSPGASMPDWLSDRWRAA